MREKQSGSMAAEDGRRVGGFSSGLAVLLSGEDSKGKAQRTHLVSCCDDIRYQSIEHVLEHVFDLPSKSVPSSKRPVDVDFVRSIIDSQRWKYELEKCSGTAKREGLVVKDDGHAPNVVALDEMSICGELRTHRRPLQVESFAMFSSARANTCVSKGKWMYEVVLETSGILQLGWATLACPFTDRKGVGDSDDSYAFDGRRVKKWNKEAKAYGQPWVVGDVIGCCIDLEGAKISFSRNGVPLGVAFEGIRRSGTELNYYPAVSLLEGERCNLNFGSHPFKYPGDGFFPIQSPPASDFFCTYLLQCLSRVMELQYLDKSDSASFQRLRRLKRFSLLEELFDPISHGICEELFSIVGKSESSAEYIASGSLLLFLLGLFGRQAPHDCVSLDRVVDLFLEFPGSHVLFHHLIKALSSNCRIAPLVLMDCPFSGSYPYLALACHILKHEELMILWWKSTDFEYSLEGFLSRKGPNKQDLQCLIPSVWRPGSSEEMYVESSMMLTTTALSGAVNKIEELQRDLCRLVIKFIPPISPPQSPGSVFRTFLRNFIMKVRGADHKMASSGAPHNSVLVSLYMVILHFLSESSALEGVYEWMNGSRTKSGGFLHRSGKRSFPTGLLLRTDPHRTSIPRLGGSFFHLMKSHPINHDEIEEATWDEGCFDSEDTKVTHSTRQKPCCCSGFDVDLLKILKDPIRFTTKGPRAACSPMPERSAHVAAECSAGSLNDEIVDKPSSSDQAESTFGCRPLQQLENVSSSSHSSSAILREEELLDALLLLYHLGVSANFKQAFYYKSHQTSLNTLLDDIDKQIREKSCTEQQKRLREARNVYREELVDCIRQCTWYRVSFSSRWKQRGTYAMCIWIVELLLVLSSDDSLFAYVPEFYLETVVDCVLALCRSDPPFVSSAILIKDGLASFVTLVVAHFTDPRILSADIKDLLLQSISFLARYKDYVIAFENNKVAVQRMPRALLSAFDNRSWILVTNILNHICSGSGFGPTKHGDSSSSMIFQALVREACVQDEQLFCSFLNRLFNTLSLMMTEFSIMVREMQDNYPVLDPQQRKCNIIFDLSCGLARILEFFALEIPQAFLQGPDINLRRLTELIVFVLNHLISAADADFFDISLRRHGQYSEKTNRAMMLGPLVGILVNLMDASAKSLPGDQNDVVGVFATMDCPSVRCGLQYLLDYNWGGVLREDASLAKLAMLEHFASCLRSRTEAVEGRGGSSAEGKEDDKDYCCICYASDSDTQFEPCHHRSCFGCITRHLLNGQRCFFCNATLVDVVRIDRGRPVV
uniref:RING-type E3 ubiquitin transferase n=1 Tax=Anthurium amnicola TaxID=1678845 RepID=A0A1D1Z8J2_9ARAE